MVVRPECRTDEVTGDLCLCDQQARVSAAAWVMFIMFGGLRLFLVEQRWQEFSCLLFLGPSPKSNALTYCTHISLLAWHCKALAVAGLVRLQHSPDSVSVSPFHAALALQLFSCPTFYCAGSEVHPVREAVTLAPHPSKTIVKMRSSRVSWPEPHQQRRKA